MRLANHLSIRISFIFSSILLIWGIVYFVIQVREIRDDIDEGLEKLKQEFILKADADEGFIESTLAHPPFNVIIKKTEANKALSLKDKYRNTTVYFPTEEEHEDVRMLVTAYRCQANGEYYILKFFTSTVEEDDLLSYMLSLLLILWVIISLSVFVGSRLIINKVAKPFYQLLNDLEHFDINETKNFTSPETNIYEFKQLNKTVEKLLEKNIQTFNDQKHFIENATHELQTPIASIANKIELALNNPELTEKQAHEYQFILNNINRMKRLNANLLLLSKIKNKQFNQEENLSVEHLLDEVLENFEYLLEHKSLRLTKEIKEDFTLFANKDLLIILLNNLMRNAIYHNIWKGEIDITLKNKQLIIANTGEPLPQNFNLFERYTSGGKTKYSSGLGLQIVTSITELYRYQISYHYLNEKHTIKIIFS